MITPVKKHNKVPLKTFATLALFISSLWPLFLLLNPTSSLFHWEPSLWFIAGALALLIIIGLLYILDETILAPPISYMLVFWVFHFGLVFPASIFPFILTGLPRYNRDWLFYAETQQAVLLSLLFLIFYALAVLWFYQKPPSIPSPYKVLELHTSGILLIGLGWLLIFSATIEYGLGVFFQGYDKFFTINNTFSWAVVIICTGHMLQLAGGQPIFNSLKMIGWAFLPIAALVALAGARTAPLFSTVALLNILHLRQLTLSRSTVVIGILALMFFISIIRETRQYGLANLENSNSATLNLQTPLSGLTELGGSLRPVSATIDYQKTNSFFWGETYIFPFVRQIERFTGRRQAISQDKRFVAERITARYGPIGYSTVAEAYINGGIIGVILFAFCWGSIISWLTKQAYTPYKLAILAVVLIPMLINIRNSFVYVPAWVIFGLITVIMAHLFSKPQTSSLTISYE